MSENKPTDQGTPPEPPSIQVGFHPLGGISVTTRSASGESATARLTVNQAWETVGHLNTLAAILVQAAYAEAAAQQANASQLVVPGR